MTRPAPSISQISRTSSISIVIPLYQDRDTIGPCLESLLQQDYPGTVEVVVVDDGSRDGGDTIAEAYPIRLLRQANAGPAAARNRGAAEAKGEILVFLDSDTVAAPDFLVRVAAHFADTQVDALLCRLEPLAPGLIPSLVQSEIDERYAMVEGRERIDFLAAAACAVRRAVFNAVGGFDPAFRSNEDVEIAFRLSAAGHVIRFASDARVKHAHQTRWRDILRAKFSRGLWRMRLYSLYPAKRTRDSWTPQTLKLQILLVPLMAASLLLALVWPAFWWLFAAAVAAMIVSGLPLLARTTAMLAPHAGALAPVHALLWLFGRAGTLAAAVTCFKLTRHPVERRSAGAARRIAALLLAAALAYGLAADDGRAAPALVEVKPDPSGQLSASKVLGFGAGVWRVPKAQRWIAPRILASERLSAMRLALAWEVLAPATSLDDLDSRLAAYPLNDFAREAAARGATIIVTIDAMPRFLASDTSARQMADGPAWAKSPPRDMAQWSAVVERVVRHFNGRLGLDATYEIWNEPDWSYAGKFDGYVELYAASVGGGRRADAHARFAGPALSDWLSPTGRDTALWLPQFLTEARGRGLPVDAVTWHVFYRDANRHYDLVVPRIRQWLLAAGYPVETPLIVDEWNIAATPPYPEGDLNAGAAGAANVAASLIAMQRTGVSAQAFQMIADPGQPGYSGGAFGVAGLPHPSFQVLDWAGTVQGRPVAIKSSQPWVGGVGAIGEDGRLRLLIAVNAPSTGMAVRSAFEEATVDDPAAAKLLTGVNRAAIKANLLANGPYPAIPEAARPAYDRGVALMRTALAATAAAGPTVSMTFALDPALGFGRVESYRRIDSAAIASKAQADADNAALRDLLLRGRDASRLLLQQKGVSPIAAKAWDDRMLARLTAGDDATFARDTAAAADAAFVGPFAQKLAALTDAALAATAGAPPALSHGRIAIETEPQSVHYLVLVP